MYYADINHSGVVFTSGNEDKMKRFIASMEAEGASMFKVTSFEEDVYVCNIDKHYNKERFNPFFFWYFEG